MNSNIETQIKEVLKSFNTLKHNPTDLLTIDELESFVFYESFISAVDTMDVEEMLLYIFNIVMYGLYGIIPNYQGMSKSNFNQVMVDILTAKKRRQKQKENGSKGGRPRKTLLESDIIKSDFYITKDEWQDIILLKEKMKIFFNDVCIPNDILNNLSDMQNFCNIYSKVHIE